ncbi:hypothetical protein TSUD_288090 [Trifolium subterraneum]|uniref:Uncharacterized protein n=1 Tax=Trifolium subterraneum TaxID=3900 RepID=A0A2Z6PAA8_TRISU|nr:hypothetical protein TSUD_288090 [Trifolium subterraneum]
MFERNDTGADRRMTKEKAELMTRAENSSQKYDNQKSMRHVVPMGGEVRINSKGTHNKRGGVNDPGHGKEGLVVAAKEKDNRVLSRGYRSTSEDLQWAQNGLVATIINGEAVPVGVNAMAMVSNAEAFFKLIFSHWMRWEKDMLPYQRGAWVRLYGVPMHAWNVNFFKLCVLDCGRFLRADSCSAEKDRLDFARVLIATPELDIVKRVERDEIETEASQSEFEEEHDDTDACRNVDILVDKIASGLEEEGDNNSQGEREEDPLDKPGDNQYVRGDKENEVEWNDVILSPSGGRDEAQPTLSVGSQGRFDERDLRIGNAIRCSCANSCPPSETRPVIPGPWSLEWLQDHNLRDAGVIFSASTIAAKGGILGKRQPKVGLPSEDRGEVLKVLKKNVLHRRRGEGVNRATSVSSQATYEESSASESVSNDWQNWVAMQGKYQMLVDDVLSRTGKGKKEGSGSQQGGARKEKGC